MSNLEYCAEIDVDFEDVCDENNQIKKSAELVVRTDEDPVQPVKELSRTESELGVILRTLLVEVGDSPDTEKLINKLTDILLTL